MINKISYFFIFLIIILPITLITGPAIPDLTVTFSSIFFIIYFFMKNEINKLIYYNLFKFSFIFWFFLLFISVFAENLSLAYRDSLIFIRFLIFPIILYLLILENKNLLNILINIIFFSVIFVCIDSIYQFLNYDPEYGFGKDIFGFTPNWYGRLTGPFYNELVPGAFVSKLGLIGIIFIFNKFQNIKTQNMIMIIYLTLIGIVTFISGERMSFLTFLLGIFLLVIFYRHKRMIFFFSLLSILLANLFIYKTYPFYNDYKILESTPHHLGLKIEKEYKCNDSQGMCKKILNLQPTFFEVLKNFDQSAYGQIYILSLKMFNDHKLQGIGLNNFTYLCKNDDRYKNTMTNYNCTTHPHNYYLQWLVETGVFGFLLFILYLYFVVNFIIRKSSNNYSILSIAVIVILFWPIMSTGSLLKNWNGIMTFFIIGLCLSLSKIKQKN
ncbi:MAG: hypothetical protein CFH18_00650 [Alphaproteobacteria bacterium MarineAlpha5_Bin8]|nr:MAG: hypothetical protein CFH17_00037 [Alphaproteobacteria bacterium MarineAlpha5_Bin7]PPR46328.1 MAG: hypothetical protein CFH18_00650 [Alphaproteobacteria bacterium MarineAlpha5_Bin8]PPR53180.1 MAG: hypothetical protein CFH16_01146 [Alphaproteobacteria bacterium MarineAlpha5_Bin6]|tara:strand:- start:11013 stop:12332 length:1320 start_codon:yes stop_codon:yes gene_type:complete